MLKREEIERWENNNLSPLAMKSKLSRGRRHKETEHPYRSAYQRDRDRIIHSAAFRRLEYKTQVFVYHEGDYYRTRLTHTLEVSQISRTIAKVLRLNEDLTEAISLAHDVGHTPFGHAVEDTLNELAKEEGGFNHNLQGLRIVDLLEERYPDFKGLNLTYETREGILRHDSGVVKATYYTDKELFRYKQPTMEAQLMDIADEIAYDSHDLDDGIKSGMIEDKELKKIEIWKITLKNINRHYTNLSPELENYLAIRNIINMQVTDLINNTSLKINKAKIRDYAEARNVGKRLVSFSKNVEQLRKELRNFLYNSLYCHWRVLRMSNKAKRFIEKIFYVYADNPYLLPPSFEEKIKRNKKNIKRIVCDFIAGMTDRFALNEYKKLFNPDEKV